VLTCAGGAAGFGATWVIAHLIASLDLPIVVDVVADARVLAYTVAVTFVTSLMCGLAPALHATGTSLVPRLRDDRDGLSLSRRRFGLTNSLVVFQVALSFVLLFSTGTLVRLLIGAAAIDLGFAVDGVALIETDPRYAGYPPRAARQFQEALLERVKGIPGVDSAVLTNGAPIGGFIGSRRIIADAATEPTPALQWKWAGPDYFRTLGIGLLSGREFDARDRAGSPAVAVINETMAMRYFGTADAVGRRFRIEEPLGPWTDIEVIGVVRDARLDVSLNDPPAPLFYRTIAQTDSPAPTILARTSLDAGTLAGTMQRELRALDPQVPVTAVTTMRQLVEDSLAGVWTGARVLGALSLLGLALAGIGLYSVVAFGVSQRTFEVGVRMALGASASQVARLVTRDAAVLAGIGGGAGALLSAIVALVAMSSGLLASSNLTFTGPVADVVTIASVAIILLTVAAGAAFVPTLKATRTDPMLALRHR
jgi:putative ABC transport system permease protein